MGRPPPQYQQHHHAGIGSQGAAPNLPRPPNLGSSGPGPGQFSPGPPPANFVPGSGQFPGVAPSAGWNGDKFSLFVGNIADGVSDAWLERIVGVSARSYSLIKSTLTELLLSSTISIPRINANPFSVHAFAHPHPRPSDPCSTCVARLQRSASSNMVIQKLSCVVSKSSMASL